MGEVYRARDSRLGRDVAIKVLPADVARDGTRLGRFRREAKALAAIDHPNIVTVFSVEEAAGPGQEGVHFLTMQLVEGQSLDHVIPASGLPLDQLFQIASAIADALTAAHDKSIVHRDLKPANVMVAADGRVKVLDFGLAKDLAASGPADATLTSAGHTEHGVVMGTPAYMSPEQVAGRAVDHRSDIFSLGILLYQMASGERPFAGASSAELASAILRDTPPLVTELRGDLPADLARLIRRCLEKDPGQRIQTARDIANECRDLSRQVALSSGTPATARRAGASGSSTSGTRPDEGFWVAVLPFKYSGGNADMTSLAEGLSEEIVTGLSRFSYLRVVARSSSGRDAGESRDVRAVGQVLAARYVVEGSLRQAGSVLRVSVQLIDASSGAHLWAETYDRPFRADDVFALQDDLVPRIVSTLADAHGILPHTMSEALRSKGPDQLSPYEAVLRSFGYGYRRTPEEHAAVRAGLERAVQQAPGYADGWAMLSLIYSEEYTFGFNLQPDPLGRTLLAARRAADAAPSSAMANNALARALFFRKEWQGFRTAAERALELNPLNGPTIAGLGSMMAYAGDWEHGCALVERAATLNPRHPGFYWFPLFYNAYRKGNYRGALSVALKINMPGFFYTHVVLAAVYGQLGERDAAGNALSELLALKPDIALHVRDELGKWYPPALVAQLIEGLRKAGLDVVTSGPPVASGAPNATANTATAKPSIAVLPFANMSADADQDYFSDGLAEEIINLLARIPD